MREVFWDGVRSEGLQSTLHYKFDSRCSTVELMKALVSEEQSKRKGIQIKDGSLHFNHIYFFTLTGIDSLPPDFTKGLLAHCNTGGDKLYNPDLMRPFAERHAPGLYDLLLRSITRNDDRVSDKHKDLQEQRVVALLHILSYFRYLSLRAQNGFIMF